MRNYDELYQAILAILPQAQMGEDNEGQLIVYTNLCESGPHGELEPLPEERLDGQALVDRNLGDL